MVLLQLRCTLCACSESSKKFPRVAEQRFVLGCVCCNSVQVAFDLKLRRVSNQMNVEETWLLLCGIIDLRKGEWLFIFLWLSLVYHKQGWGDAIYPKK